MRPFIEKTADLADLDRSLELWLTNLWETVLETKVKPDDDFFELGGHSLQAIWVMNRLQEHLDTILQPTCIFEATSVHRLSDYCRNHYPDHFNKISRGTAIREEWEL